MASLILEFTRTSVRGLHVDQGGWRARMRHLLIEPLREGTPAQALTRLMGRLGATPAQVVSVMPREQIMTRMMKVPAADPAELAQIVELSGRTQFPYPPQKMLLDYHVVGQEGGVSTVQLVGCRREVVEQHLAELREAGVEPDVVTPSSWGILAWYQHSRPSPSIAEPVCVVNVDADHTELVVIQSDRLLFSRVLGEGVSQWQGSPGTLEPLWQELKRSLSGARQDWPGLEIRTCVLIGLGPLEQYKSVVEEHLGASVVVQKSAPDAAMPPHSAAGVSAVVVSGLGGADPQQLVNLLPQEAQRARARRRLARAAVRSAQIGLAACWITVALLGVQIWRQARVMAQATAALHQLEPVTEELSQQEHYIQVVERVLASRRQAAERLAALMRVTPADVAWRTLAFDQGDRLLVIGGSAPTTRRVLDYVQELQHAKLWDQVDLRYTSRRSVKNQSRTDFEIALQVASQATGDTSSPARNVPARSQEHKG